MGNETDQKDADRITATIKPLEWTEPAPANYECRYDHVFAVTEFGRYSIEWKSWKEHDSYCGSLENEYEDDFTGGSFFVNGDTLEHAKQLVWEAHCQKVLALFIKG